MIREEDMNNLSAPTPLEVRKYRVGNTFDWDNKKIANMLCYVDARYVMDRLDAVVGGANWDSEFLEIKGRLYCKITIRYVREDGSIGSAFKMDCGTEGNIEKLQSTSKHQKGGLSGKPLETISNQLINIFYNLLKGKIEIIGVGGVDSGKSAYDKFLAGANFIQLYTGMVYQGPNIVGKIKKELKQILINEGVSNFKYIVGKKSN